MCRLICKTKLVQLQLD